MELVFVSLCKKSTPRKEDEIFQVKLQSKQKKKSEACPCVVRPLQAGLLDGGSIWQQRASLRLRPVLPAQRRYDGRQLLLHLHAGGRRIHLQPAARRRATSSAPWETALLGIMMMMMWLRRRAVVRNGR